MSVVQRERRGCSLSAEEADGLKEWRKTDIKEGHFVDYLRGCRWRYGVIKEMESKQDQKGNEWKVLHIQPQMEGMYHSYTDNERRDVFTEEFQLNQDTLRQIARPLTKSVERMPHILVWRKKLTLPHSEEGDDIPDDQKKCDVLDYAHKWYTATILETDPGANRLKIRYDGWPAEYDAWCFR